MSSSRSSGFPRVLGSVAVALTLAAWPAAAGAEPATLVSVTCTGQSTITYSPPVTDTPQPLQITADGKLGSEAPLGTCTAIGATLTGASYHEQFQTPAQSCNSTVGTQSGTRVYTWDDSETSTFSYTTVLVRVGGQSASLRSGTITSGRFSGLTAQELTIVPVLDPLLCATTGVPSATSQTTLTIGI
ncbi:hypothetical protein [Kitasatospora sp. NPDC054795]